MTRGKDLGRGKMPSFLYGQGILYFVPKKWTRTEVKLLVGEPQCDSNDGSINFSILLGKEKYFYKIKWLLNLNKRYETKYRFFLRRGMARS